MFYSIHRCNYQAKCSVDIAQLNVDPCDGTSKYLEVVYLCQPRNTILLLLLLTLQLTWTETGRRKYTIQYKNLYPRTIRDKIENPLETHFITLFTLCEGGAKAAILAPVGELKCLLLFKIHQKTTFWFNVDVSATTVALSAVQSQDGVTVPGISRRIRSARRAITVKHIRRFWQWMAASISTVSRPAAAQCPGMPGMRGGWSTSATTCKFSSFFWPCVSHVWSHY